MAHFLPQEFNEISNLVTNVRRKSANEYSSSCPTCGGTDRFVMFIVGRYGAPLGFCRQCGYKWTPRRGEPTREEIEEWRKNQIEVEKARKASAERSLEILQAEHAWERFYQQNNQYSLDVFRGWGIAESWIEYLKLGLIPDYTVRRGEERYHSPAATIPVWFTGGVVQNIKLRILNPQDSGDRYRNFYPMGQSFLFVPLYDLPLQGKCVLVEGEKKAIVMEQTLDDINYRVVGLQSKTPAHELFSELKDFEVVYIWLDPDAKKKEDKGKESALEYVTRMVGRERARIIDCNVKSDDGIMQGMNPMNYIRMAKRA